MSRTSLPGLTADFKNEPYWWDLAKPAPSKEMALPKGADVVIVGSGYTGLSTALLLARAGRHVVVLDKEDPGFGASRRRTGRCAASRRPGRGHGHPRCPPLPGRGLGAGTGGQVRGAPDPCGRCLVGPAGRRRRPLARRRVHRVRDVARGHGAGAARAAHARVATELTRLTPRRQGRGVAQLLGVPGGGESSCGRISSKALNICTPVPSPHATSWASWSSVTPRSRSAETSLYSANRPSSSRM